MPLSHAIPLTPRSADYSEFAPLSQRAAADFRLAARLGFWAAVLMAVCALLAFGIGLFTLPNSGPYCVAGCLTYPYADAARYVPRDYFWIYPAILVPLLFVVVLHCLIACAPAERKLFGQLALSFALLAAAALAVDYIIQLAVMQVSLLDGEQEGLVLVSMYNPHGVFIALEDLGYLLLGVALLCGGWQFAGKEWLVRGIRGLWVGGGILALGGLAFYVLLYGKDLEYRYEVLGLTIAWTVLILSGILVSILLRRLSMPARTA